MNALMKWGASLLLSLILNTAFSQGALFTYQGGPATTKHKPRFKDSVKPKRQTSSITGMESEAIRKKARKEDKINTVSAHNNAVFVELQEQKSQRPYTELKSSARYNPVYPEVSWGIRQHGKTKRIRQ